MEAPFGRPLNSWRILIFALLFSVTDVTGGLAQSVQGDNTVVLRDLTIIRDVEVTEFDESALILSNGTRLRWDEVLSAEAPEDRNAEFDELLSRTGETLYRLKTRLRIDDWAGAGELAEPIYEGVRNLDGRDSANRNRELDFLVCLAVMKGRLFSGNRVGAVEPFLVAATIQSSLDDSTRGAVEDFLLPVLDVENLFSSQIIPHWFDQSNVANANRHLANLSKHGRLANEKGAAIYLASMAIAVKAYSKADEIISKARAEDGSNPVLEDWLRAVEIERYLSAGEPDRAEPLFREEFGQNSSGPRSLVVFLRGRNPNENKEIQLLSLLAVPALFGDRFPNLSSSALYHATSVAEQKGDSKEARILRNELLRRYPNTYHGRLAKDEPH